MVFLAEMEASLRVLNLHTGSLIFKELCHHKSWWQVQFLKFYFAFVMVDKKYSHPLKPLLSLVFVIYVSLAPLLVRNLLSYPDTFSSLISLNSKSFTKMIMSTKKNTDLDNVPCKT